MLNVIDEFTHECLAIRVARRLKAIDVIDVLSDLFILRGVPGHIRSGNGPEFVTKALQEWNRRGRRQDGLYRARQPLGEWLRRELQRPCGRFCEIEPRLNTVFRRTIDRLSP
jgi:putative transposase